MPEWKSRLSMTEWKTQIELETRAKRTLNIDVETEIGIKVIAPYAITTRGGDLQVVEDLPDDQFGLRPMTIYYRTNTGLTWDFKHARLLEFLEVLKQHMVLEDLADV